MEERWLPFVYTSDIVYMSRVYVTVVVHVSFLAFLLVIHYIMGNTATYTERKSENWPDTNTCCFVKIILVIASVT